MTQQEEISQICAQIVWLQDKATAASMECVKYMGKEGCTKKYLKYLREHVEITREINRLKGLLNSNAQENQTVTNLQ